MSLFDSFKYASLKKDEDLAREIATYLKLKDSVLERKEPVYLFKKNGMIKYVLFPRISVRRTVFIKCFEINHLNRKINLVTDKRIIQQLLEPEISRFVSGAREAIEEIEKKVAFAEKNIISVSIIIPKMGGLYIYLIFEKLFGINWRNHITLVNFSKDGGGMHKSNMRRAISGQIKPVFLGKERGKMLIFLDEVVSGSSMSYIVKILLEVLDKEVNIKFDDEKDHLHNLIKKEFHPLFEFRKKNIFSQKRCVITDDYNKTIHKLRNAISDDFKKEINFQEYNTLINVIALETKDFFKKFEEHFFNYLSTSEKKDYSSKQKDILNVLTSKLCKGNPNEITVKLFDRFKKQFFDIFDLTRDSLLRESIRRRIYEEWVRVFNLHLFFVTVRDTKATTEKMFKKTAYYFDILERDLGKNFSVYGIPCQDLLNSEQKRSIEHTNLVFIERFLENIDEFENNLEIIKTFLGIEN